MKNVTAYTDGACSGNPGPGGWGVILLHKDKKMELSGFVKETTNNRMELTAAIEALSAIKYSCEVDLYTDSAYLCNAFNSDWIGSWLQNGWKTSQKKPVENIDLWHRLIELSNKHKVNWIKVKGHADNEYNNRCDKLAREAISKALKQT